MSPTKISGLPAGVPTTDDLIVFVDNADGTTKQGPITGLPTGGVTTIIAGANISVNNSNPSLPVVSFTGMTTSSTDTLSNKSISFGSNTVTMTKSELNTAVTDGNVVYVGDTASNLNMNTSRLLGRSTASSGSVEEITLGSGLSFTGTILKSSFITTKADLPTPSGGIITLADNTTYYILNGDIDLTGDRFVCGQNTTILGGSSENSILRSTGLSASTALITSTWTLPIRFITITHGTAIALDATANANQAIDWIGVNFTDCATVGTVKNYSNFVQTDSAFLNSQGLTFDGTFGTIAFGNTLFDCSTGGTSIILPSTLTVSRRFRIIYSSFVTLAGETALNVSTSATISNEGYILDTINFAGGGTYITGVQFDDNKSLFVNCKPISNSGNIAQYYMTANATTTTVGAIDTFYKVAGTTSSGTYVEKFTLTNNRATYSGSLVGFYKITAYLTFSSGANNIVRARIGKNGTTTASSESKSTANAGGRSENLPTADIVSLTSGDYIEIFVANGTATTNILVSEITVIVERLN